MNKCQIYGCANYLFGKLMESLGHLIGNSRLQIAGYQRQIAGRAKCAVGDAQKLIRDCARRQARSGSVQAHGSVV